MSADVEIAVVGAGPAGLAAALEAIDLRRDVAVLEAEPEAGGNLRAVAQGGATLALGPQAFPRSAQSAWWLVERSGLLDAVVAPAGASARFVYRHGRLHRLPGSPGAFVSSRLMSLRGKLRLMAEPFQPRGGADGESVRQFFTRRLGAEAVDALVAPFVTGIHAADPSQLEAASAFPRQVDAERRRGSLLLGLLAPGRERDERARERPPGWLFSVRGGLSQLAAASARALGARLCVGHAAVAVVREAGAWRVEHGGGSLRARSVALAVPPHHAARLLRSISSLAADFAAGVPMAPVAVVHLGGPLGAAERAPSGFGVLVARGEGLATLGAVYTSSLFPDVAPARSWLQATYLGGALDPTMLARSDAELHDVAARESRTILQFEADRGLHRVIRHAAGIPQLVRGHRARIEALRREAAGLRGLALAGNWLDGIGLDAAIASGRRAARELAA